MALFLSVFTRPVAEVNITEANRDKLEISWYSLLGCIQGDMMVFIFFFFSFKFDTQRQENYGELC